MVGRGELKDAAWAEIEPLPPRNTRRGRQWRDRRQVLNGILWKLRTGAPWRDLSERYGPWRTCYDRFVRAQRARHPDRKPTFDKERYRRHNVVERCVNRLKRWRGVATRSEKRAASYRAMVVLASLMIWLGA